MMEKGYVCEGMRNFKRRTPPHKKKKKTGNQTGRVREKEFHSDGHEWTSQRTSKAAHTYIIAHTHPHLPMLQPSSPSAPSLAAFSLSSLHLSPLSLFVVLSLISFRGIRQQPPPNPHTHTNPEGKKKVFTHAAVSTSSTLLHSFGEQKRPGRSDKGCPEHVFKEKLHLFHRWLYINKLQLLEVPKFPLFLQISESLKLRNLHNSACPDKLQHR